MDRVELKAQVKLRASEEIERHYPIHKQLNAIANYARATNKEVLAMKKSLEYLMKGEVYSLSNKELSDLRAAGDMANAIEKIRRQCKLMCNTIDCVSEEELLKLKVE